MRTLAMREKSGFFAERLRRLRTDAGLTQQQLADLSGLAWATIQQFESARREPAFAVLVKLAAALGVSLSVFDPEGGTEAPEPRRGRPPKPKAEPEPAAPPKKRGRPRKDGPAT